MAPVDRGPPGPDGMGRAVAPEPPPRRSGVETGGPRPNPWRRASDDRLVALVKAGLRASEIAARVGIAKMTVYRRIAASHSQDDGLPMGDGTV